MSVSLKVQEYKRTHRNSALEAFEMKKLAEFISVYKITVDMLLCLTGVCGTQGSLFAEEES